MLYFICIILFIILTISFIRTIVNNKRQILFNEMNAIYDKMEVFIFSNSLQNKKEVIAYILPFKNFVVNNGFADIEILINSMVRMPKEVLEHRRKQFKLITDSIPNELKDMSLNFDKALEKAIKLSAFRMEFVFYFIKLLAIAIGKSFLTRSFNTVKNG